MSIRNQVYEGEILVFSSNPAVKALTQTLVDILTREFGVDDLQAFFGTLYASSFFDALEVGRIAIQSGRSIAERIWDVISSLGESPRDYRIDLPRLRVVPSLGREDQGSQIIRPHRDVWFAEPRNQINLWTPLCGSAAFNLAIWSGYFDRPIPNTSHKFDWQASQTTLATGTHAEHPQALAQPQGAYESFDLSAGDLLVFSANHLHGTLPNRMVSARVSIDFRIVHVEDYLRALGPKLPDNRSSGTSFWRLTGWNTQI